MDVASADAETGVVALSKCLARELTDETQPCRPAASESSPTSATVDQRERARASGAANRPLLWIPAFSRW